MEKWQETRAEQETLQLKKRLTTHSNAKANNDIQ